MAEVNGPWLGTGLTWPSDVLFAQHKGILAQLFSVRKTSKNRKKRVYILHPSIKSRILWLLSKFIADKNTVHKMDIKGVLHNFQNRSFAFSQDENG
jgi:hypothetical protein